MTQRRILIVEDERLQAVSLRRMLERLGYEVPALADSAEAALQMSRQTKPDLVLMDIKLEGRTDGVDAALMIMRECSIPTVFITGNTDSGTYQRAMEARPLGYLEKPIDPALLRATLREIFEGPI